MTGSDADTSKEVPSTGTPILRQESYKGLAENQRTSKVTQPPTQFVLSNSGTVAPTQTSSSTQNSARHQAGQFSSYLRPLFEPPSSEFSITDRASLKKGSNVEGAVEKGTDANESVGAEQPEVPLGGKRIFTNEEIGHTLPHLKGHIKDISNSILKPDKEYTRRFPGYSFDWE